MNGNKMKKLIIVIISLTLMGCGVGVVKKVREVRAQVDSTLLQEAEVFTCESAAVGAVRKFYCKTAEGCEAYNKRCGYAAKDFLNVPN